MEVDHEATPKLKYAIQIPFACEKYAETAMRTVGVEPAFSESRNKKTTITRKMEV